MEMQFPYYDFNGKLIENENDEKMRRKYGYNYGGLKEMYPEVYKLPEGEIEKMIREMYNGGKGTETFDDVTKRMKTYIEQKEPEWKSAYFGEKMNAGLPKFDWNKQYVESDLKRSTKPKQYPIPAHKPQFQPQVHKPQIDINKLMFESKTALQNDVDAEVKRQQQAYIENQKRLEEYYNKGFYLTPEQWLDVAKATGKGLLNGAETLVNGISLNTYQPFVDLLFNDAYTKRKQELQKEANLAGVGDFNKMAQRMAYILGLGKSKLAKDYKTYIDIIYNLTKSF